MMKRRMWSLAIGLVCAGMTLSVSGHAGWAPQKAQAVASMSSLELPALKKPITKRFVNSKLTEVLAWLSLEEFSFVADAAEFPQASMVTLNFRSQPLGAVLDAISDAFGGRWERRGDIFTLRPGSKVSRAFGTAEPAEFFVPATGSPFSAPVPRDTPVSSSSPRIGSTGSARNPGPFGGQSSVAAPLAPAQPGPFGRAVPGEFLSPAKVVDGVRSLSTPSVRSGVPAAIAPVEGVPFRGQGLTAPVPLSAFPPAERALQGSRIRSLFSPTAPVVGRIAEGEPIARAYVDTAIQDPKAHQEAMREVERALRQAEVEMKRLHESGEWKKTMERAMSEAHAFQGDEHRKAMEEVHKAMEMARKEMQNLPNSAEWKKTWEKAREEIRRALKEGKVTDNGTQRRMTDKERQALEKSLKSLKSMESMKAMPMFDKNFVMPKLDGKLFTMPKMEGHTFVMPKIQGRSLFGPDDADQADRNKAIQKRIEEMRKRMKEMGVEGKLDGHTFIMPKMKMEALKELEGKSFVMPKVKIDAMPELKALEKIRPFSIDSRKMRISELLASLTDAQKEKQEKQGYLSLSDLTPKQREMLGNVPDEGNWTFSYSIDGKKLTVKNK